jgi:hypothetical protein
MNAIETKKIRFLNTKRDGVIYKTAVSDIGDPDINHVTAFRDMDTLNEFILSISLALEGRYEEIEDPDFTKDAQIAFIGKEYIEFWDEDGQNMIDTGSLADFKELLIDWRDFLSIVPQPRRNKKIGNFVSHFFCSILQSTKKRGT